MNEERTEPAAGQTSGRIGAIPGQMVTGPVKRVARGQMVGQRSNGQTAVKRSQERSKG